MPGTLPADGPRPSPYTSKKLPAVVVAAAAAREAAPTGRPDAEAVPPSDDAAAPEAEAEVPAGALAGRAEVSSGGVTTAKKRWTPKVVLMVKGSLTDPERGPPARPGLRAGSGACSLSRTWMVPVAKGSSVSVGGSTE